MTHPYDTLQLTQAKLIFTPCPGTKNTSVDDAVNTLKQAGTTALITLMPSAELAQFNASQLSASCAQQGITWFHLPIADDAPPNEEFEAAFAQHQTTLLSLLNSHNTIAIHCRGGSGRTGLMAAILLLSQGLPWVEVKKQIQTLRPNALKNEAQLAYLRDKFSVV